MSYSTFTKGPIKIYPLPGTEKYVQDVTNWLAKFYLKHIRAKDLNIADYFYMDEIEEASLNKNIDRVEEFLANFITGKFQYFAHKNGALEVSIDGSARKKDVYVFHTFSDTTIKDFNGVEKKLNSSDQEVLLYNTLDAFLEAKVERVTLFEMNLGQARSDRPKGRGSCNLRTFFRNITANGADHLFVYQLHSAKSLIGIDNTKTSYDNLSGENLLKKYILRNHVKSLDFFKNVVQKEWIISSVDAGGKLFAAKFAKALKTPLLVVDKRRNSLTNLVEEITVLKPDYLSIEGKTVYVVDDMIDTGGSIVDVCRKYRELGAKEINIAVVYGIFSPPAEEKLSQLYKEGAINKLIVTDLVKKDEDFYRRNPYIEIADTTYTTARIILKTNMGRSLEKYFVPLNAEEYITEKVEYRLFKN